jgi:Amt family ammonium transporter
VISYYVIVLRMTVRIDESLDVFACHGMGGMWGMLAAGIFASKSINPAGADGLIHGNIALLGTQAFAVVVIAAFSFVLTLVIAKLVDLVMGLRVKDNEEMVGLDISQHAESIL